MEVSEAEESSPEAAAAGRWAAVAGVAAVLPVLVAGIRAALTDWMPTGDVAYSSVRAWDVFSRNQPLLGTMSSASDYTERDISHAGPLQFDLLAIPVRVLGHGPGTAIGMALVNATAVALLVWLVHRRLGPAAAALAAGASALLSWSMGSDMLFDPWGLHAPLIPFSLFLVAVWCVVAGDLVALPVMAVSGSLVLQTHLSYAFQVPILALVAIVAVVVQSRRGEVRPRRWGLVTLLLTLLCWTPPLLEQFLADGEGNLSALFGSAGARVPVPGPGRAIRAFGGTVALPPMFLPPSFGSPAFSLNGEGPPTWLATAAVLALAAGLVVLGLRARRRGSAAVAAGCWLALAMLAAGFYTTLRMPVVMGMVPTYARFMWPLGMVVWLIVGVALLDEVRSERARRWLIAPGVAFALVAGVAGLARVDHETGSPPWTVEAVNALDDEVVAAAEGKGPVLVELGSADPTVAAVGPGFLGPLQKAGIPFLVSDPRLVRQLGGLRRYDPGESTVQLIVKGGRDAEAAEGEVLVAAWSPLSAQEEERLEQLTADVEAIVAEHGVALSPEGREVLEDMEADDVLEDIDRSADDPGAVELLELRELWAGVPYKYDDQRVLDTTVFPAELMDEWGELYVTAERRPVSVYLARIQT